MTEPTAIDDELFFAWLDGELEKEEADRVGAAVSADPALAARAEAHRDLGASLRGAFDPVMDGAPPRFGGAEVVDLAARREQKARPAFGVPQWAAIAASLLLGVLVGGPMLGSRDSGPVSVEQGQLVASGELGQALDVQLAATQGDTGTRVGISFLDKDGEYCRSFTTSGAAGLACRDSGRWQVEGMFGAPLASSGTFRMANGEHPQLAALIDERIAGEPLDAAGEAAAQKAGWR